MAIGNVTRLVVNCLGGRPKTRVAAVCKHSCHVDAMLCSQVLLVEVRCTHMAVGNCLEPRGGRPVFCICGFWLVFLVIDARFLVGLSFVFNLLFAILVVLNCFWAISDICQVDLDFFGLLLSNPPPRKTFGQHSNDEDSKRVFQSLQKSGHIDH